MICRYSFVRKAVSPRSGHPNLFAVKKKVHGQHSPQGNFHNVLTTIADIYTDGMDLTSLSSNWKSLQATLKKAKPSTPTSATKRKASDRDSSGHGTVKKRKSDKEQPKSRDTKHPHKRKRMLDGTAAAVITVADSTSTTLRRKSSSAGSAKSEVGSRNGKVNEGRSPT